MRAKPLVTLWLSQHMCREPLQEHGTPWDCGGLIHRWAVQSPGTTPPATASPPGQTPAPATPTFGSETWLHSTEARACLVLWDQPSCRTPKRPIRPQRSGWQSGVAHGIRWYLRSDLVQNRISQTASETRHPCWDLSKACALLQGHSLITHGCEHALGCSACPQAPARC